ncbi:MAG TPA: acyltransferase, partial [Polyangiaceae bacterium]
FVLSGFLITGILLDTRDRPRFFLSFYLRRTLRIFPLYYVFLFFLFVVFRPLLHGNATYRELLADQAWYWTYLQNWRMAFHGWPELGMDHLWSLAVEEQFYMVWPLAVFLLGRQRIQRVALGMIAAPALLRALLLFAPVLHRGEPATLVYTSTFTRVDALACGAWVAATLRTPIGGYTLSKWAPRALAAAGAGLLLLVAFRHNLRKSDVGAQALGFSLLAVFFAALVARIVTSPADSRLVRAFAWAPLRKVGTLSYAAYVFHYPLMEAVSPFLPASMLGRALFLPLSGALTFGAALLSWKVLEAPLLEIKERISPSPLQTPAPAARPRVVPSSGAAEELPVGTTASARMRATLSS